MNIIFVVYSHGTIQYINTVIANTVMAYRTLLE